MDLLKKMGLGVIFAICAVILITGIILGIQSLYRQLIKTKVGNKIPEKITIPISEWWERNYCMLGVCFWFAVFIGCILDECFGKFSLDSFLWIYIASIILYWFAKGMECDKAYKEGRRIVLNNLDMSEEDYGKSILQKIQKRREDKRNEGAQM